MDKGTVFRFLFFALLEGVLLMRIYFTMRLRLAGERFLPDRQAIQSEGQVLFIARAVLFFLLIAFLVLYAINPQWMAVLLVPLPSWLRWIGFVLGLASLGLGTWAQMVLGKEWSPQLQLRREHHLVTKGPYALVRHPIYTAMIGYEIGLGLLTANWVFIGLIVPVVAGLVDRIPKEERMMIELFGSEYLVYMQHTGQLFPKSRQEIHHNNSKTLHT